VSEQVKPKEPAIGVRDISTMTKAEALAALAHKIDTGKLSRREALAVQLIDLMVADPHTVTDEFFAQLKGAFTEDELIELVFAASIFIWGNHFNITMRVDTDHDSAYPHDLAYAEASAR
jgi:alkylhydroperoxidase family enzyme